MDKKHFWQMFKLMHAAAYKGGGEPDPKLAALYFESIANLEDAAVEGILKQGIVEAKFLSIADIQAKCNASISYEPPKPNFQPRIAESTVSASDKKSESMAFRIMPPHPKNTSIQGFIAHCQSYLSFIRDEDWWIHSYKEYSGEAETRVQEGDRWVTRKDIIYYAMAVCYRMPPGESLIASNDYEPDGKIHCLPYLNKRNYAA